MKKMMLGIHTRGLDYLPLQYGHAAHGLSNSCADRPNLAYPVVLYITKLSKFRTKKGARR